MSNSHFPHGFAVRHARRADIPAIRAMQEHSLLVLLAPYYTPDEIDAMLGSAGTMDDDVVDEGHYFLVFDGNGTIVASGGWSQREPGYERTRLQGYIDRPAPGTAIVRSVFVHPRFARRGLATALMNHIENDARRHGIRILRLMATLSGVDFYGRQGYLIQGSKAIALPDGLEFGAVSMVKSIRALRQLPTRAI